MCLVSGSAVASLRPVPGDLISLVHRQPACLQMLRARMGRG
jgi:hypothetical protein